MCTGVCVATLFTYSRCVAICSDDWDVKTFSLSTVEIYFLLLQLSLMVLLTVSGRHEPMLFCIDDVASFRSVKIDNLT